MLSPDVLLRKELWWFLWLLVALMVYRMLTGGIRMRGLLADKATGQPVSAERVQLLVATLALSAQYIGQAAASTGRTMPDVGGQWLVVFGASSSVYAGVKAAKMLRLGRKTH